jgi:hypothetical protein
LGDRVFGANSYFVGDGKCAYKWMICHVFFCVFELALGGFDNS